MSLLSGLSGEHLALFHSKLSGQLVLLQAVHVPQCHVLRQAAPPTCALGMHASTSSTNSRTGSDSTGGSSPPALADGSAGSNRGEQGHAWVNEQQMNQGQRSVPAVRAPFVVQCCPTPAQPQSSPAARACRQAMVASGTSRKRVSASTSSARASMLSEGSSCWRSVDSQPRRPRLAAEAAVAAEAGPALTAAKAGAAGVSGCCSRDAARTSV